MLPGWCIAQVLLSWEATLVGIYPSLTPGRLPPGGYIPLSHPGEAALVGIIPSLTPGGYPGGYYSLLHTPWEATLVGITPSYPLGGYPGGYYTLIHPLGGYPGGYTPLYTPGRLPGRYIPVYTPGRLPWCIYTPVHPWEATRWCIPSICLPIYPFHCWSSLPGPTGLNLSDASQNRGHS